MNDFHNEDSMAVAVAAVGGMLALAFIILAMVQSSSNSNFCAGLGMTYERGKGTRWCIDDAGQSYSLDVLKDRQANNRQ